MNYLVDTHALIWWWDESDKLSDRVRTVMADRRNTVFVSAAAAWEIGTKVRLGRLPSMAARLGSFETDVIDDGFRHLPIMPGHGLGGGMLKGQHGDPFDRLIAAQALAEDLTVITRDPEIAAFGCETLW